jgi:hypothetical protein
MRFGTCRIVCKLLVHKKSWIALEAERVTPSSTGFSGVRPLRPVKRRQRLGPQRVFVVLGIVATRLALLSLPHPSFTLARTICACGGSGNKGFVEVSVSFHHLCLVLRCCSRGRSTRPRLLGQVHPKVFVLSYLYQYQYKLLCFPFSMICSMGHHTTILRTVR